MTTMVDCKVMGEAKRLSIDYQYIKGGEVGTHGRSLAIIHTE